MSHFLVVKFQQFSLQTLVCQSLGGWGGGEERAEGRGGPPSLGMRLLSLSIWDPQTQGVLKPAASPPPDSARAAPHTFVPPLRNDPKT